MSQVSIFDLMEPEDFVIDYIEYLKTAEPGRRNLESYFEDLEKEEGPIPDILKAKIRRCLKTKALIDDV